MTVQYNPAELSFAKTIVRFRGTVLPLVLGRPTFWTLYAFHALLILLEEAAHVHFPPLPFTVVGTMTGLLTFFVVFYGSQCYSRLQLFYSHCVGIGGTLMNWAGLVALSFPEQPTLQWNATRHMLAAMHVLYYTLNESHGSPPISDDEWDTIRQRALLSSAERQTVTAYRGFKPFLLVLWSLREVEAAIGEDATDARAAALLAEFRGLGFAFRGHCGQIVNWLKMPVPFPYFHVLKLLQFFVLLFLSYGLVSLDFAWGTTAAVYALVLIAFIGLTEVAVAMADPFGDDDVDFELEEMLSGAFHNAVACLLDQREPLGARLDELVNPLSAGQLDSVQVGGAAPQPKASTMSVREAVRKQSEARQPRESSCSLSSEARLPLGASYSLSSERP